MPQHCACTPEPSVVEAVATLPHCAPPSPAMSHHATSGCFHRGTLMCGTTIREITDVHRFVCPKPPPPPGKVSIFRVSPVLLLYLFKLDLQSFREFWNHEAHPDQSGLTHTLPPVVQARKRYINILTHDLFEEAVRPGTTSRLTRRKCLFSWVRRRTHNFCCPVNRLVVPGSTGP